MSGTMNPYMLQHLLLGLRPHERVAHPTTGNHPQHPQFYARPHPQHPGLPAAPAMPLAAPALPLAAPAPVAAPAGLPGAPVLPALPPPTPGVMPSDRRMKTDEKEVGRLMLPGGELPIKSFRFKGDPVRRLGFVAQDVEKTEPNAVFTHPRTGVKGVDYARVLLSAHHHGMRGGNGNGGET